ncbi:hypothetical protein K2173_010104 [Erythroxylum novogranatense]|uniref:Uncharacterized protein n=1 Tax=Erythroxylum novogranatense TaxID=1862640 RepID=A0AAV8SCB0_9ROSI|nr:hypothetical protein K2173_010104 [Erythroxylum novogranatense]
MENLIGSPLKESAQDCRTPSQAQSTDSKSQKTSNDMRKSSTPDRLKVPKAFKYPERYRSPTDLMISPVTKGLLARNTKAALLPPSMNLNQAKAQDMQVQEVVAFQLDI